MRVFVILPAAGLGTRMSAGHSSSAPKQFLELHGGTLSLESTVDIGTTVTITLPASRIAMVAKAA